MHTVILTEQSEYNIHRRHFERTIVSRKISFVLLFEFLYLGRTKLRPYDSRNDVFLAENDAPFGIMFATAK